MKSKFLLILFPLLIGVKINSLAQSLNFDKIRTEVNDSGSNQYYPFLLSKFNQSLSELNEIDFLHLYFGKQYYIKYNPKFDKEYLNCIQNSSVKKKTIACSKALINDPTNLELLSAVYNQTQSIKEKELLKSKFSSLWKVVKSYGNGKSRETPYVVNSVGEIYTISSTLLDIDLIKYQRTSTSVKGGTIDKFYTKKDSLFFKVIYNLDNLNLK